MSDIMTVAEVADLLRVHPNKVYAMVNDDPPLPHFRVGSHIRFLRDNLLEHLEAGGKP